MPATAGAQLALLILALAGPASPAEERDGDFARNMIEDGGFEMPAAESAWIENNWDGCVARFERSRLNPHAGSYCQRVTIHKKLGRDVQLLYPNLPIGPGSKVRLEFWIRGPQDTASLKPIEVLLRKWRPPYTCYFRAHVRLTPAWNRHVFNVTLPANTDKNDTCLMFVLAQETSFWLDDVSLRPLRDREPGEPLEGNQIANGSFEVGRDRWYATFRESGGYGNSPFATERNIDADLRVVIVPDAPHGTRVLHFEVFPKCSVAVTSAYFRLRYGHPATVSFWLKSSVKGAKLNARVGHGLFPRVVWEEHRITCPDTDWNRYTFTFVPSPSSSGTYFLELSTQTPAEYWLDAVIVNEGSAPLRIDRTRWSAVGWEPIDGNHPANIFSRGERVAFAILAYDNSGRKSQNLTGRVIDAWERAVATVRLDIPLNKRGLGQKTVELPSDRLGSFKCELFRAAEPDSAPAVEIVYHIPPKLTPLKQVRDSFFGGHFRLTPYNLHIAEQGGFRWLRLHPPLCTKWLVVEPQKGRFSFSLAGVKRARSIGFRILGTLGSVPTFYSSAPSGKASASVFANYAPSQWPAWREYCLRTMQAFGPYIDHWENWNEPDGGFLRVRKDQNRLDLFMKLHEQTYHAVRSANLPVTLVGGAVASLGRPLLWDALEAGVGKYCDAVSFHHYGPAPDRRLVNKIRALFGRPGRGGKELEVWHSEGGFWLATSRSWLKTAGIPATGLASMTEAAAELVKTLAVLKAIGVRRHFHYADFAHPAGRIAYRGECANLIDVNGIPHAAFGAHAAAVLLLEGSRGQGLEERKIDEANVRIARFERHGKPLWVLWSDRPIPLSRIHPFAPATTRAFDMMGNPLRLNEQTRLGTTPIYLLQEPTDTAGPRLTTRRTAE